jgi:hypothetical protein
VKAGVHAIGRPWWGSARRARRGRGLPWVFLLVLGIVYAAWPYVTLWRLDRALVRDDRGTLGALVDLAAVRGEIARKLNKEETSTLGPPSDAFIEWLEQGIRRNGTAALEHWVDLDWVRERLLSHASPQQGMVPALTRAFFDDPLHFSARVGRAGRTPVFLRLTFDGLGWRVTSVYF